MLLRRSVRRSAAALMAASTLPILALSGCSADDTPAGPSSPSIVSPSPLAGAPASPSMPPAKDSAASRRAFARYVMTAWSTALRTDDPTLLLRASAAKQPCRGCAPLAGSLARRAKAHWYVDFPGLEVHRIALTPRGQGSEYVAEADVTIPASRSYFDDGRFRNVNPAHQHATFTTTMSLRGHGWVLLGFRVG